MDDRERIRFKMRRLRRQLDRHSSEWSAQAHRWLDWKYQVSQHPLLSVGIAAAAGYLLIPRKKPPVRVEIDEATRREIVKQLQIQQFNEPISQSPAVPTLWQTGVTIASQFLLRSAINYGISQIDRLLNSVQTSTEHQSSDTFNTSGTHDIYSSNTPIPENKLHLYHG